MEFIGKHQQDLLTNSRLERIDDVGKWEPPRLYSKMLSLSFVENCPDAPNSEPHSIASWCGWWL